MWTTFITYFKATGPTAPINPYDGLWIHAVANAAAGQALVDDATVQAEMVQSYGAGELRRTNAAVQIPHLLTPAQFAGGEGYYSEADTAMQDTPLVQFPGREGIRLASRRFEELYALLHQLGGHYPPEDVAAGDSILFGARGGVYIVFQSAALNPLQKLQWLLANAAGPADGPRATAVIPANGAGNSVTITMPQWLAPGADGNDWTVEVDRSSTGLLSVDIQPAAKTIGVHLVVATTTGQLKALLDAHALLGTTFSGAPNGGNNVEITGSQNATFAVPAMGAAAIVHDFSGGSFAYDQNDPVTIAPIVAEIPVANRVLNGAMFFASPGPAVRAGSPPIGTRYTLAQVLSAAYQEANRPSVADLQGGRWFESLQF